MDIPKLKHITRLKVEVSGIEGFWVRIYTGSDDRFKGTKKITVCSRVFNANQYGSLDHAHRVAVDYRDQQLAAMKPRKREQ